MSSQARGNRVWMSPPSDDVDLDSSATSESDRRTTATDVNPQHERGAATRLSTPRSERRDSQRVRSAQRSSQADHDYSTTGARNDRLSPSARERPNQGSRRGFTPRNVNVNNGRDSFPGRISRDASEPRNEAARSAASPQRPKRKSRPMGRTLEYSSSSEESDYEMPESRITGTDSREYQIPRNDQALQQYSLRNDQHVPKSATKVRELPDKEFNVFETGPNPSRSWFRRHPKQVKGLIFVVLCLVAFVIAFPILWTRHLHSASYAYSKTQGSGSLEYKLKMDHSGSEFFDNFEYETVVDPTGGFVNYVSKSLAQSKGYTYVKDAVAYIYPDTKTVLDQYSSGRDSIRILSKDFYTTGLFILDLAHMPAGCGVWPAFWTTSKNGWPKKGEIDILENVNLATANAMTLHSSVGCSIDDSYSMLGTVETDNCYVYAAGQSTNKGCSITGRNGTFGAPFNNQGGGIYAMEWRENWIKVWTFVGHDSAPADIKSGSPDPSSWTEPSAFFSHSECDMPTFFYDHHIIINLDFCGSWAGDAFAECAAETGSDTCSDYIASNPSKLKEAYWAINSLKVYQA